MRWISALTAYQAAWRGCARLAPVIVCATLAGCSSETASVSQPMMPMMSPASVAMPVQIVVPMPVPVTPPPVVTPQIERRNASVKIGKPYQVAGNWYYPAPGDGYDEDGIASWYGPDFNGKPTANGEIYNMHRLTAAHPTLPMPCYAAVTNSQTGRTIVVRINDRGPYKSGRIIDLSYRAAQAIGVTRAGTADVRVKFLRMAPLLGDDSYEEKYLARQPWSQSGRLATAAPAVDWTPAVKTSFKVLRHSKTGDATGWLAGINAAQ